MGAMGSSLPFALLMPTSTNNPSSPAGNISVLPVLKVAELIDGLKDLGCKRTTGEDQTVCVMSDSFNALGKAEALQAAGDLPHVEVVKVCCYSSTTGKSSSTEMLKSNPAGVEFSTRSTQGSSGVWWMPRLAIGWEYVARA